MRKLTVYRQHRINKHGVADASRFWPAYLFKVKLNPMLNTRERETEMVNYPCFVCSLSPRLWPALQLSWHTVTLSGGPEYRSVSHHHIFIFDILLELSFLNNSFLSQAGLCALSRVCDLSCALFAPSPQIANYDCSGGRLLLLRVRAMKHWKRILLISTYWNSCPTELIPWTTLSVIF